MVAAAVLWATFPASAGTRPGPKPRPGAAKLSTARPGTPKPSAAKSSTPRPSATQSSTPKAGVVAPTGWTMTWHDEFDGPADTAPARSNWGYDLGGEPQWGNREWEYYTDRTQNVSLDGSGHLGITARRERLSGMSPCENGTCDITSGRIVTRGKVSQKYGRIEASIKVPSGKGMWPAFWMMGNNSEQVGWPDCGEIDIMETVNTTRVLEGTAWGSNYPDSGFGGSTSLPNNAVLASGYHTYAIEWDATKIVWYLDSTAYFTFTRSQLGSGMTWPFDQPFYVLLNLAVGGEMSGSPDSTTPLPNTMLVDYVRMYQRS